jgi:hypothetical protein
MCIGGIIAMVLWSLVPRQLTISTRVVGYATWADFNFVQWRDLYYILAFIFPAATLLAYVVLNAIGARTRTPQAAPRTRLLPLPFVNAPAGALNPQSKKGAHFSKHENPGAPTGVGGQIWSLARVLVPALALTIEVGTTARGSQRLPGYSILAGFAMVGAVYLAAALQRRVRGRTTAPRQSFHEALSRANAVAAVLPIPLLILVSSNTTIFVESRRAYVHYPWLPVWLIAVATLVCISILSANYRLRNRNDGWHSYEGRFLAWAIGPLILFLLTAQLSQGTSTSLAAALSGQTMPKFWGFDDSHWLALPRLIFQHGLLPWRDVYSIHGLLQDVFAGQIGLSIFNYSWWGAWAGLGMIVIPIFWICQYAFVVYVSRQNYLVPAVFVVAVVSGLLGGEFILFSTRFMFFPLVLILFDQLIRKPKVWIGASFATLLFFCCLITPEIGIFALLFVLTLFAFELTTRQPRSRFPHRFSRTLTVVGALAALSAVWAVILYSLHSLKAFIDFVPFFAFSRSLEVAIAINGWAPLHDPLVDIFFALPLLLWWATVWRVVIILRTRRSWVPLDWLLVVGGVISISYLTKAIDIPDQWHVVESFSVSIPLLALWAIVALQKGDKLFLMASSAGRHSRPSTHSHVVTAILSGVVVLGAILLPPRIGNYVFPNSITSSITSAPSRFHGHNQTPAHGLLGYTVPGSVNVTQIAELGRLIDRYAGPHAPVVDYSNEPGVLYFLLNRVPGSQFYIQEVVQTVSAQRRYIHDLQTSRPPVVVFHNMSFGFPDINNVPNSIRSYAVTNYLFTHYTPLLNYQGQLLLLRNDLRSSAPAIPSDVKGLRIQNLYFSNYSCNLGDIPNYFTPPSHPEQLPTWSPQVTRISTTRGITSGWAVDPRSFKPAWRVVAVSASGKVVGSTTPNISRWDVAAVLRHAAAGHAGFRMQISQPASSTFSYYGLTRDGHAFLLFPTNLLRGIASSPLVSTINFDNKVFTTSAVFGDGQVEQGGPGDSVTYKIGGGTHPRLAAFPWFQITSDHSLGGTSMSIAPTVPTSSSALGGQASQIQFNALPSTGTSITVPVQGCMQWYGYAKDTPIYVTQYNVFSPSPLHVTLIGGTFFSS